MYSVIDIINLFSTYLVLLPILIIVFNFNKVAPLRKLLIYLILSLIVEIISTYNYFVLHTNFKYLTLTFVYFEAIFIYLYFYKYYSATFNKILLVISILYTLSYFLTFIEYDSNKINIIFGGGILIVLLISFNNIISSIKQNSDKWFVILNFSIFTYSLINSCTNSFASFFIENKEHISLYIILISLSNIVLYIGISISVLLCKKKYMLAL